MTKTINENQTVKYRVVVRGNVLLETASLRSAEQFVGSLSEATQQSATIVPITSDGAQVLLG